LTELVVRPKRSLVTASIKGIDKIGTVQSAVLHARSGEVGTLCAWESILLDITANVVVVGHAQIGTSEATELVVGPKFALGGTSCAGHTPVLTGLGVLNHPGRLQVLTNDASRCAIDNLVNDDRDGHWHGDRHRNGLDDDVAVIPILLTASGLLTASTFHFSVASIDADGKRCNNGNHFGGLGEIHGQCRALITIWCCKLSVQ